MGEYYIPFQQPNDPSGLADDLSEAMWPGGYGHWAARLPNIVHMSLDGLTKTTRLTSIHYTPENRLPFGIPWNIDYGKIGFYFAASFDMTNMTVIGFDWLAYDRENENTYLLNPCLSGTSQFFLEDVNSKHAWVSFTHPINSKNAANFSTYRFSKADFTADTGFLWTKVQAWMFFVGGIIPGEINYATGGYDVWIDGGPFVNIATTLPTITIACQDAQGRAISGKSSQWAVTGGISETIAIPKINTPVSIGEYTVTILSNDFIKWKLSNGTESTLRSVTFTLNSGDNYTATAVFQSGTIPDGGGEPINWATIALAGGVIIVTGVAAYLLLKPKRRNGN